MKSAYGNSLAAGALIAACFAGCLSSKSPTGDNDPAKRIDRVSAAKAIRTPLEAKFLSRKGSFGDITDSHFPDAKTGFFVGKNGMILVTRDAGRTFANIGTGTTTLNAVRFSDTDHGMAVGDQGLILRTVDGGSHWAGQHVGTSALSCLSLLPGSAAIAFGAKGEILKSHDGGQSWSLRASGITDSVSACLVYDSATVMASAGGWFLVSRDGGETWTKRIPYSEAGWGLSMASLRRNGDGPVLGLSRDNRPEMLLRMSGSDSAWDAVTVGYLAGGAGAGILRGGFRDFAVTAGDVVYMAGGEGAIERGRLNEPLALITITALDTPMLQTVEFPSEDTGFAAGDGGQIIRTIDGGKSWQSCDSLKIKADLSSVDFIDAERGVAAGSAGSLMRTSDGGKNWQPVLPTPAKTLRVVRFSNGRIGCAVGDSGAVLWTNDGGGTWNLGGTGTESGFTALRFTNDSTAYLASDSLVFKSGNGGRSWASVTLGQAGPDGVWDLDDGLSYDGVRFADLSFRLPSTGDSLWMETREPSASAWTRHSFTGRTGRIADYAQVGPSLYYAVGGSTLFRFDSKAGTLDFQDLGPGIEMRGIDCPVSGTCFAVGDKGLIVRLTSP